MTKKQKLKDYSHKPDSTKAQAMALLEMGYNHTKIAKSLKIGASTVKRWKDLAAAGELDIEPVAFAKMKEVATAYFMANDLELAGLSHSRIKKELKDKKAKHKLSDITEIYRLSREPYIIKQEQSGNSQNLQVNIKAGEHEFSVDM